MNYIHEESVMKRIDECFKKHLGYRAEYAPNHDAPNELIVRYVNTTDEKLMFPCIEKYCIAALKDGHLCGCKYNKDQQEKGRYFLDTYMKRWRAKQKKEHQQANNKQTNGVLDLTTGVLDLPSELNTERAKKYFAKAIEVQCIKVTNNGLQWVFGCERGRKASLGYFIQKVYCPNNTETIPETAINKLFGVTRIGSAITQITNAKKPQKWRTEIDKLFE